MSTVIVVGAPLSGYLSIWEILRLCDIKTFADGEEGLCHRSGLSEWLKAWQHSSEISAINELEGSDASLGLQPVHDWLNQQKGGLVGWATDCHGMLSERWLQLVPDTKYVLVFGDPGVEFAFGALNTEDEGLRAAYCHAWCSYNNRLLQFFKAHPESCIVLNGPLSKLSVELLVEQLSTLLKFEPRAPEVLAATSAFCATPTDKLLLSLSRGLFNEQPGIMALQSELESCTDAHYNDAAWNARMEGLQAYREDVHTKDMLLLQLHLLQEEFAKSLARRTTTNHKKNIAGIYERPYGASERVKGYLSYRLGGALLKGSKSLRGIFTLPRAIQIQIKEFEVEKKRRESHAEIRPPLNTYADAEQGYAVMQHLSYRLGEVILSNYNSPLGWIRLPYLLHKTIRDFHRAKIH